MAEIQRHAKVRHVRADYQTVKRLAEQAHYDVHANREDRAERDRAELRELAELRMLVHDLSTQLTRANAAAVRMARRYCECQ